MNYLVFSSLEDAQTALDLINLKVRQAVTAFNPQAIDENGIISRNAKTGRLRPTSARTTSWSTIQETVTGVFILPLITTDVNPVVFAGIDFLEGLPLYTIEEYNPLWFSSNEEQL
ncbi:hypothetical protein [Nodularia sphaerocarpa]|uniref:hypothetical protein n=1 Tax=Nodularia sphaerocarpa TaxID=137816 RepID=UPI001EFB14BD|nr:hypothetical protein [Nodularia sphaerocarpa]MDB9372393.1 hypothetical protein [Nodularia sphaerocarpa CS-585]ULP71468.1 hypothetical protein BDGGKGIB_01094 [Nodularia sphaerocarpa UHCC 0038]ULP73404.1 hypothetical protein BDGGKGIB_03057 [Nodularia sphaerocarpa UHCC 0038]